MCLTKSKLYTTKFTKLKLLLGVLLTLPGCNSDTTTATDIEKTTPDFGAATSADFVAIKVQAENFSNLTGGWTLTSPDNTPDISPDPDPPHYSTASGNSYLELLPDTRVTHDDQLINGQNFWPNPGQGPRLDYNIVIPESGRYYVFVKAYSTGPEDNGIHVGINGEMPESGKRIQLCAGKNRWTWSSAQRVDTNHCGVTKTIYLDVETAGSNTINFHAREDGYELDQFLLLKDNYPGVTNCFPLTSDKVSCVDIASGETIGNYNLENTPTTDGNIVIITPPAQILTDLKLSLSVNRQNVQVGDEIEYTISVKNIDDTNTATGVTARLTIADELSFISSDRCTVEGNQISCDVSEVSPGQKLDINFTATAAVAGDFRVDAQITAEQQETSLANNTDSVEISATPNTPDFDGMLSMLQGPNAIGANGKSAHLILIKNIGLQDIDNASLVIRSNNGLTFNSNFSGCSGDTVYSCPLPGIRSGADLAVPFTVTGGNPGSDNILVNLAFNEDQNILNNNLNIPTLVIDSNTATDDNGIISLETETYDSQIVHNEAPIEGAYNSAWFINSASVSPTIAPDFDSTSSDTVSNAAYVEFLPDTRLDSNDPIIMKVSNYLDGGESSTLRYKAFFNTTGRYHISALIRANNDQDASIHLGIDDNWPQSAEFITACNADGTWQWTNTSQCNSEETAYIDIQTPGLHTIMLSAATDGVEVDKIELNINNSNLPVEFGSASKTYVEPRIDLALSNRVEGKNYIVEITNPDETTIAAGVKVVIDGVDPTQADSIAGFDGCAAVSGHIECDVNYVDANSSRTAIVPLDDAALSLSANLLYPNDPVETNNMSTATATDSGGGALDFRMLLLIFAGFALCRSLVSGANRTEIS